MGFGTFKGLFPALGGMVAIPWKTAHNCWLQIFFEGGGLWLTVAFGYFMSLAVRLFRNGGTYSCFIGLMMIGANMMIHFPTRMIQTVLLIIFFCAYCEGVLKNGRIKN